MSQKRSLLSMLLIAMMLFLVPFSAQAKWKDKNGNEVASGENWFGSDFDYDITDTKAVWELLMKPITVLDVGEKESVYPLDAPEGKKIYKDKLGGFLNGSTAAVHVLGEDENGWTLIEGLDYYDRLIQGYVKTKLLKTATPNEKYGIVIDKLTQKLYFFIDGEFFSSCNISTGLVNKDQPYNETAAGEYLTASFVGQFVDGDMYCDKVIRFNNGDAIHEVPYIARADGSKSYSRYEPKLGSKASHGCIRVQRVANEDGLCMEWIWDTFRDSNIKGVKMVIWDDDGRALPYPDDSIMVYYNPDGGQNYHSDENCSGVRKKYLPLTGFTYGELDSEKYAKLTPCQHCDPLKRKSVIDKENADRGVETPTSSAMATSAAQADPTASPDATDSAPDNPEQTQDTGEGTVEVIIH